LRLLWLSARMKGSRAGATCSSPSIERSRRRPTSAIARSSQRSTARWSGSGQRRISWGDGGFEIGRLAITAISLAIARKDHTPPQPGRRVQHCVVFQIRIAERCDACDGSVNATTIVPGLGSDPRASRAYEWNGVFVPTGTPAAIVAKLNAGLNT